MMHRASDIREIAALLTAAGEEYLDSGDHLEVPFRGAANRPLAAIVRAHNALIECFVSLAVTVTSERRRAFHVTLARINRTLLVPGFMLGVGDHVLFRAVAFLDHDDRVDLEVVLKLIATCKRAVGEHLAELEAAASMETP